MKITNTCIAHQNPPTMDGLESTSPLVETITGSTTTAAFEGIKIHEETQDRKVGKNYGDINKKGAQTSDWKLFYTLA